MPRFSYRANSHNAKFPDIPANKVYVLQSNMRQVSRIKTFAKANGFVVDGCVCGSNMNENSTFYAVSQTCGSCNST